MKKIQVIFLLSLHFFSVRAADVDILELRDLYYKASTDRGKAKEFHQVTLSASGPDKNVILGYLGMSYMIKANFAINPYNKLSYFVKGRDRLDQAIMTDPKNIELRFLRFCVQSNAPDFLGYNGKIVEDKLILCLCYGKITDKDLKERIREFMMTSKYCTSDEKKAFEK